MTIYNVDFQSLAKAMAYTQAINEGQRPVSSKDRQETDGRTRPIAVRGLLNRTVMNGSVYAISQHLTVTRMVLCDSAFTVVSAAGVT